MPVIRKATRGDAKQLSRLAERTFRETFGAANTAENMELHCRATYSENIQAGEISDPNRITLLCVEEERLIGYVQLRWNGAPACVPAKYPGEVQRLYVDGDWHGKGIAHELMNTCIQEMTDRGSDVVWLGVWECNPRAISFYRKFGFAEVGDHIFSLGDDPQRDIVMARAVRGADQALELGMRPKNEAEKWVRLRMLMSKPRRA